MVTSNFREILTRVDKGRRKNVFARVSLVQVSTAHPLHNTTPSLVWPFCPYTPHIIVILENPSYYRFGKNRFGNTLRTCCIMTYGPPPLRAAWRNNSPNGVPSLFNRPPRSLNIIYTYKTQAFNEFLSVSGNCDESFDLFDFSALRYLHYSYSPAVSRVPIPSNIGFKMYRSHRNKNINN